MLIKQLESREFLHGSVVNEPDGIYEDLGSMPGLTQ